MYPGWYQTWNLIGDALVRAELAWGKEFDIEWGGGRLRGFAQAYGKGTARARATGGGVIKSCRERAAQQMLCFQFDVLVDVGIRAGGEYRIGWLQWRVAGEGFARFRMRLADLCVCWDHDWNWQGLCGEGVKLELPKEIEAHVEVCFGPCVRWIWVIPLFE